VVIIAFINLSIKRRFKKRGYKKKSHEISILLGPLRAFLAGTFCSQSRSSLCFYKIWSTEKVDWCVRNTPAFVLYAWLHRQVLAGANMGVPVKTLLL